MDERRLVRLSKYLSRHLRHDPQRLGLTLEPGGWVRVQDLLEACRGNNVPITRAELDEVVARNDKRRFGYDPTGTKLRASQGHSIPVDLGLAPAVPPATLFHGTNAAVVERVLAEGLRPMGRQHVHLSPTVETARTVGARRGRPVVLAVDAAGMASGGHVFWVSDNGVWLTDSVPPDRLKLAE